MDCVWNTQNRLPVERRTSTQLTEAFYGEASCISTFNSKRNQDTTEGQVRGKLLCFVIYSWIMQFICVYLSNTP